MRLVLFNYFLVACRYLCFGGSFRLFGRPLPAPALECELIKELTGINLALRGPSARLCGVLRLGHHFLACGVKSEPFELFRDFFLFFHW